MYLPSVMTRHSVPGVFGDGVATGGGLNGPSCLALRHVLDDVEVGEWRAARPQFERTSTQTNPLIQGARQVYGSASLVQMKTYQQS